MERRGRKRVKAGEGWRLGRNGGRGEMEAGEEWRQGRNGGGGGMEAGIKICIHVQSRK